MINVQLGSKQEEKPVKPFPKLMVSHNGNVVLFISPEEGVCLHPGGTQNTFGDYSCSWSLRQFTDYNEPVTLQNA